MQARSDAIRSDLKLDATDLHKIHNQQFQHKAVLHDVARSSTATGENFQQRQAGLDVPRNPAVEMFILENPPVEPHATDALRSLPPDMQMAVITSGSLAGARCPTAVLMGRVKKAKTGQLAIKRDAPMDLREELRQLRSSKPSAKDKRSRSSSSSSSRSRKKRNRKKKKRKSRESSSSSSSSCVIVVEKEGTKHDNVKRNTDVAASSSRSDIVESADDALTKLLALKGN